MGQFCVKTTSRSGSVLDGRQQTGLQGVPGPWIIFSNINHALQPTARADEIDLIVIGPSGVFVIEVKHWDNGYLKHSLRMAQYEAVRVDEKAKRVAGKIRQEFDPGFVSGRFLFTRPGVSWVATQRPNILSVSAYGLTEWRELLNANSQAHLSSEEIERAANILEPRARLALVGDLHSFGGLINLERLSASQEIFHRVYRGQHSTRRDKVILHLYDLSANDDKQARVMAEREFEVIQRWQKSPYLPSLLDSFQEAEHYPGELFYFSLVDSAAPTIKDRSQDLTWTFDDRLRFARQALLALHSFHEPDDADAPRIVHRRLTPATVRVRHNGSPLFTDFSLSRLADAPTISGAISPASEDQSYLAPEVRRDGFAAGDARADVFSLCATLKTLFSGIDARATEVCDFLELGCTAEPEDRESLIELAGVLDQHTNPKSNGTYFTSHA